MPVHISAPATAETLLVGPSVNVVHVPGAATVGRLSAVEMSIDAGWVGPPPHVHDLVDHFWYVLDGEVDLVVDGAAARYGAGACLFIPAGTAHSFSTANCGPVRVLQVDTPQALDGYFRELASTFPRGTRPDPAAVGDIMSRHDTRPIN